MHDRELYRQILGIQAPWEVSEVEVDLLGTGVTVHIRYSGEGLACPECNTSCPGYDTRTSVVVKIDVAFFMFKQPEFRAALLSQDSATQFLPVPSFGSRRSSVGGADCEPIGRRHGVLPVSQCPGRYDARAA